MTKVKKVVAVLPAYNAAKTLEATINDIPPGSVHDIILVDDASQDRTVEVARSLGLTVFFHSENLGYGGNQKTCYTKALQAGADIIVMLHPDYQYDPKMIPDLIEPVKTERADVVFGSRTIEGGALEGGMPWWKYLANIGLTWIENIVLGTQLTEFHSGFRAYSRRFLQTVRFLDNSDNFVFDTEIIVQSVIHGFRIEEIPIQTRYFPEASTIKLWPSIVYGFSILWTMVKYLFFKMGLKTYTQFMAADLQL